MAQTRAAVRSALYSALSDTHTGINAQYATITDAAVDAPGLIDFTTGTNNIAQAFVTAENWEALGLVAPALAIYTTSAQNLVDVVMKSRSFSGIVQARADFHLKIRELHDEELAAWTVDRRLIEDLLDAVEEAAVNAVDAQPWQGTVQYAGSYRSDRFPPVLYGDGYYAVVPVEFTFRVLT